MIRELEIFEHYSFEGVVRDVQDALAEPKEPIDQTSSSQIIEAFEDHRDHHDASSKGKETVQYKNGEIPTSDALRSSAQEVNRIVQVYSEVIDFPQPY